MDLYRKIHVKIRKEDAEKAQEILDNLKEAGDIDNSYQSYWDKNTVEFAIAPIISDEIPTMINKLIDNGIRII